MTKTLDRSLGYGEVFGHEGGARYEQNGVLFDSQGNEVVPVAVTKKGRGKRSAEELSVADQVSQFLEGEPGAESV